MSESIVLDIQNLKSHFFTMKGEVPAVDGVSIQVPAGKIIGIVGESGCGKSMTAMSVMGLFRELVEKEGVTIVMTTHDMGLIGAGDRVFELQDGTLADREPG